MNLHHHPAMRDSRDRPFDVVLLDFGGVCLVNPVELHHRAEELLGLEPGTLDWLGPLDPATDPPWREMTIGNGLSERDYWHLRAADVGTAAGRDLSLTDYMTLLYDPPTPDIIRPEATAVTKRVLASGCGVSVLTNDMSAFHGAAWAERVPFLTLVDHVVDCSDTDILKPDPRAYRRALDILAVAPDRVLFVDDQPGNVTGAIDAGMEAMWFDIAHATESWAAVADAAGVGDAGET